MAKDNAAFRKESAGWIAVRRLWLTRDGRIVEDGDYRAWQLLAPEGGTISLKTVKRLALETATVLPIEREKNPVRVGKNKVEGGYVAATAAPEVITQRSDRAERVQRER